MKNKYIRDHLRQKLISVFSSQPEIFQIHFFGREAEGRLDDYSDIDMIACTRDPAASQGSYRDLLDSMAPIAGSLLLNSTGDILAYSFIFKDYRPYQKLDLSLTSDLEHKSAFGPFITVYEDDITDTSPSLKFDIVTKRSDLKHMLNDMLFAAVRFCKYLHRGDYNSYRFWKFATDRTMNLLYEKYFGWQETAPEKNIGTFRLKKLFENIRTEDKDIVAAVFPCHAPLDVAKSYRTCFHFYITLTREKAAYLKVNLDAGFIDHISSFLDAEIDRFLKK